MLLRLLFQSWFLILSNNWTLIDNKIILFIILFLNIFYFHISDQSNPGDRMTIFFSFPIFVTVWFLGNLLVKMNERDIHLHHVSHIFWRISIMRISYCQPVVNYGETLGYVCMIIREENKFRLIHAPGVVVEVVKDVLRHVRIIE